MSESVGELAVPRELVLVSTGERLPATRENAAAVLLEARERKARIDEVIRDAEEFLAEESRRQGTKTFETDYGKIVLSGGETTVYDEQVLMAGLREAGCPEERIDEVVRMKVTYEVNRSILKQLTAANPAYAQAAERAAQKIEKRITASVKAPTRGRKP